MVLIPALTIPGVSAAKPCGDREAGKSFEQFGGKLPLGRHALNVDERCCPRDNDRLLECADAQHDSVTVAVKAAGRAIPSRFTDVKPGSANVTA